ncbi:high frequency lysogenization protein HflD [Lysobacter enzymogenes]|uniref:High frequency lysogenization protein HflD homolog n=1 Tax=Lysobacter enzymogenes TaxID=69 RepID=A0AAU9AUX0_LYSEN|nr:high frequency lysogenization protein HflD [Lysobacter enzymogenes]BAV98232.1 high frequency lysogenization protein hflD homolog [Lysobacter enzymogenes]SDX46090.1 high frequency lysogenization protein [Lysobacter enzymogenes]
MAELSERTLALAGLAQALAQVRRIADTGQANASVLQTALDSVFRIDASSPSAVYGGIAQLRPGLMLAQDYFSSRVKDEHLPRLGLAVLQLERRFVQDGAMTEKVLSGIRAQADNAQRLGSAHPDVIAALGTLYADTLSHLRPRVLVQGNPHYLGQPGVVAEVRAVLLAAVRSAVLWRQLGGSYWDFVLRKRAMVDSIDARLD